MNLATGFTSISSRVIWLGWFAGIFVVVAVIAVAWLAFPPTVFLGVVLLVIAVFFFGTLVRSYLDIAFLDREMRLASTQVRQLVEINDIGRFVQTADPSIFRQHIQSLYTIFRSHPEIKQDNLVEITHARLMARNKVVELFASVLVTLGLIGTIVGLIDSTTGLGDAMQSMFGPAAIAEADGGGEMLGIAMVQTFGGLKTAFYTTLLGSLFGGVVLRLLTNIVDAAILRYMAHLAELTEVNVLPPLRRMASTLQSQGYYASLD